MAKKGGFLNRLELESAAKGPDVAPKGEIAAQARRVGASSAAKPGRAGKVNVTGYFHPDVKRSLMMIRLRPEKTGVRDQDLLAEALNDLFAKYNVPQTAKLRSEDDN